MVDFKKQLGGIKAAKPADPIALYETLDRAHDKGPLRPAQQHVLSTWYEKHQSTRDNIVKLHTGQGKTLVGLLMLQSRLNQNKGPAVYLCPNNFLIAQTCEQAKQFGIQTCISDGELPDQFTSSQCILVTSASKLFNGMTKFGLHNKSKSVGTILMDDAHACADKIRDANRIRIPREEPAYDALRTLFATEVEFQGVGTYADISNDDREAFLPVPYWTWIAHETEVAGILASNSDRSSIKFVWPIIKNILPHCQCIISGAAIEIEPYVAPLETFGSYWRAEHRIFMSATVTDDAFLVKGLRLKPETITSPISFDKESWSGEKMILLPSLISEDLTRELVVHHYAKPNPARPYGVVALTPSFARTADWERQGTTVAKTDTVEHLVATLRKGQYTSTLALVNRYDGIDLPDDSCRILVFDGKPFSESLIDLYHEQCCPGSETTLMRTVRSVEQGMGRSVRGEKDYSVLIILGNELTRLVRDNETKKHVSPQTAKQIDIGLQITEMAKADISSGSAPQDVLFALIRQCLGRDEGWKAFYTQEMDQVRPIGANADLLKIYEAELEAEEKCISGNFIAASDSIQRLLDEGKVSPYDRGWYLQEMARYQYRHNIPQSQKLQASAHQTNRMVMRPQAGATVVKLTIVSQGRVERIISWMQKQGSYEHLQIVLSDVLGRLTFGTKADRFESALDELSAILGFAGERPDKEWKEGPDNLWALDSNRYIVWECKSEVDINRSEINKREAEQMNRSSSWFDKHYSGAECRRILIHPASVAQSAAAFTHEVEAMRDTELRKLVKKVQNLFKAFASANFADLSPIEIQKQLNAHGLTEDNLMTDYGKKIKDLP